MIRPQTCAVCGNELDMKSPDRSKLFPFCSDRCRMVDLYRWMDGSYAIVEPLDPEQVEAEIEADGGSE